MGSRAFSKGRDASCDICYHQDGSLRPLSPELDGSSHQCSEAESTGQ